jgi:hypothetical protein
VKIKKLKKREINRRRDVERPGSLRENNRWKRLEKDKTFGLIQKTILFFVGKTVELI